MLLTKGENEETLLVEMLDLMPGVKDIISSVPEKEIEMYCYEHDGFYRYMKMPGSLAQEIADGRITVPKE